MICFYFWGAFPIVGSRSRRRISFDVMAVIAISVSLFNLIGTYVINVKLLIKYSESRTALLIGTPLLTYNGWEITHFAFLLLTNISCLIYLRMRNLERAQERLREPSIASQPDSTMRSVPIPEDIPREEQKRHLSAEYIPKHQSAYPTIMLRHRTEDSKEILFY